MSTKMEWQKISGEVKFDNPCIHVTEDTENSTIHRYHIDQVLTMIDRKEIADAITIGANYEIKPMLLSK